MRGCYRVFLLKTFFDESGDFIRQQIARVCCSVPLYHIFGCVIASVVTVAFGGTSIIAADYFDASACLDTIEEERCTALYGVPTMYSDLMREQKERRRRVDSLRTGIMAGSPCPAPLLRAAIDELHLPELLVLYGSTELSPGLTASFHNDEFEVGRRVAVFSPGGNRKCRRLPPFKTTYGGGGQNIFSQGQYDRKTGFSF